MTLPARAMSKSLMRCSDAFERFGAAAAVLDASGVIAETNEAWRLFATLNDAAPGTTGSGVDYLAVCERAAAAGDPTAETVAAGLRSILLGDRASFEIEYECPSPLEDRSMLLQASTAPVHDGAGVVLFHLNVTGHKLREGHLATAAHRDPATGLPDRRAALAFLDERLAPTVLADHRLTVLHLRLDGLGAVDDLGDRAHDDLLVQIIQRTRRGIRADDRLCRLADNELAVLCADLDDAGAAALALRLRDVIAAPFQVGATEVAAHVAVGTAVAATGSTAITLLATASEAGVGHTTYRPSRARPHETSRAQRDAVVANSSDLVLYFELDGTIAWVSPATRSLLRMEPEALLGRNGLEMIHPDDQERTALAFASITGPGDFVRIEFRVVTDDGTVHWIEETATNLVDDPYVGYVVGNLRDITAHKRDEEAIRLQGRLLDAAGQGIVAIDLKGRVIYWNRAAAAIYGWAPEEALGRPVTDLVRPADGWTEAARAIRDRVGSGASVAGDYAVRRRDGVEIPIRVTNTPVYDDAGTQIGIISVSTDITERKQHELEQAELSGIVANSTDAMFSTTLHGVVQSWNHAAEQLYGYTAANMVGNKIAVTVPPDLIDEQRRQFDQVRAGRALRGLETRRRRADGADVPVSISISPICDSAGNVVSASAVVRDITEQVELRRRLEADHHRLAEAQRSAHLGSFELDFATHTLKWSEELHAILGLGSETPASPAAFRARVHPDDREHFEAMLSEAVSGNADVECTHRIVRPDGEVRWVKERTSRTPGGTSTDVSGTVLDITDRKLLELDLLHQATHDPLTGLANRRLLLQELDSSLATSAVGDTTIGVLLFDVDRFKVINDSLGHDLGDQLLVAIADALPAVIGPDDRLARFGSDAFVVVTENLASPDDALELAQRIRTRLSAGLPLGESRHTPTISVGIVIPKRGEAAITVLRDADTAMYRAKERGRDRAEWFDPSLHRAVVAGFEMERELRHAIAHDELYLAFQPVLNLEIGRFTGCEALVRWHHPERGDLDPDEFIPVAENTGLIVPLGTWVLREAISAAAGWPRGVYVAVNLSARQLAEPDLFTLVRDMLDELSFPASRLVLEVTETAVLQDPTAAARTIFALRALGIRVVIDDFGTGYTSLSFLRDYRLDGLKIDRSFIAALDQGSTPIVDAIIRMSGALGLRVIAEGVETELQIAQLRALGCKHIQGYLVSPPLANADLPFPHMSPAFLEERAG